jgi:phosphatidylserine/phosphatidylglycerophosphate/cardiolipin synthase-like enzyme
LSNEFAKALVERARAGVKVHMIVDWYGRDELDTTELLLRKSGIELPRARHDKLVSRGNWKALQDVGVEIYEYQPTKYRCKMLVVDEYWASVGSSDLDDRSLMFNDEANLNEYDASFARKLNASFAEDLKQSKPVSREARQGRPWAERVKELLSKLSHR